MRFLADSGRSILSFSVDARVAGLVFGLSLTAYGVLALRIAAGDFLDYWNLAFDTDPRRFAEATARSRIDWAPDTMIGGLKHSLVHYWAIIA